MTIPLTGAGSFYVRAGHIFRAIQDSNALRGSALTTTTVAAGANLATRAVSTIQPDYNNGTAIPQAIDNLQSIINAIQSGMQSGLNSLGGLVKLTLLGMWNIDANGVPSSAPFTQLTAGQANTAIAYLCRQMFDAGTSIQQATVSAGSQTAVGTPVGNPIVVASLVNGSGIALMLPFPETLFFTCTKDVDTGATAGNEPFSVVGGNAAPDPLSFLYPAGSGVNITKNAVDGSKSNSAGNLLYNSDFTAFSTANYPDNWVTLVGTAGSQIFNGGSGNAYTTGGGSLQFLGTAGALNTAIAQTFATQATQSIGTGGTPATLVANGIYHLNLWLKVSVTPSAGVLTFDLIDGTDTTIANDNGDNCSFTKSLTAVSTSFVNVSGAFQLPSILPSSVKLRIRLSTAIDSGKSVYMGRVSMALASTSSGIGSQGIYNGGPYITIHSGNTNPVAGFDPDKWTMAISNSYATTGSGLMQLMMDRVFGMRALGLQVPVSGSPTAADSLIA